LINEDAISDFYSAFHHGAACFYIITASSFMQKHIAGSFIDGNVAVYDYSGKEKADTFYPKDIIYFIEDNKEKRYFLS